MSIVGIIPARYSSSRFPGKPLAVIQGKSMLQRVVEQTKKTTCLDYIIVATDDERISAHCEKINIPFVITSPSHPSGTDRCFEALTKIEKKFDYVINIQGDEPFLHPEQIDSLAKACDGKRELITQMTLCKNEEELFSTDEVKIVLNNKNEALYFSRSVIPYIKNEPSEKWTVLHKYYRHVGMYAYRSDILEAICKLTPSGLEKAESLEQLRWLEAGYKIFCVETNYESHCIDRPEDIERVLAILNGKK